MAPSNLAHGKGRYNSLTGLGEFAKTYARSPTRAVPAAVKQSIQSFNHGQACTLPGFLFVIPTKMKRCQSQANGTMRP